MRAIILIVVFLTPHVFGGSSQFGRQKNVQIIGSEVTPTIGQPWPKPQLMATYGQQFMVVRPALFRFETTRHNCDILEQALKRYYSIIFNSNFHNKVIQRVRRTDDTNFSNKTWKAKKEFDGYLDSLRVDLLNPCEQIPHDEMDESYELKINTPDFPKGGFLTATTNWGLLRGLETFVQLLHPTDDFTALQIKNILIVDYPRFPFRAILLDTSRHFLSKKVILQNLDLMAMNKMNVFHWHIVDDQSFPYQSISFPAISNKGAYHPYTHVYTQQDIAEIIEYARVRGIRVVSEFDSPGHTLSWGPGVPGLLTECFDKEENPDGKFGPVDPTNPDNFDFLRSFFQEIAAVFPDKYLHLGGDEVDHQCWESNPEVNLFMEKMNYTEYSELEGYYMQQLIDIVQSFPRNNSYLVWQEVFDRGVSLANNTIVHVWKNEHISQELFNVTKAGYRALTYACWYLNYISYGIDWEKFYSCDPLDFPGNESQKRLILGGGAAMWSEYVDSTNLIPRLWPRAALPAERLWSNANVNDTKEAGRRLEEHRCRLLKRGYNVEPVNGPGFCLISWE